MWQRSASQCLVELARRFFAKKLHNMPGMPESQNAGMLEDEPEFSGNSLCSTPIYTITQHVAIIPGTWYLYYKKKTENRTNTRWKFLIFSRKWKEIHVCIRGLVYVCVCEVCMAFSGLSRLVKEYMFNNIMACQHVNTCNNAMACHHAMTMSPCEDM